MKRDMDYVRDLLLKIEGDSVMGLEDLLSDNASKDEIEKLEHHMTMLVDQTNLVSGVEAHSMSGKNWLNIALTWQGHDYLDSIRDPEIWDKTKKGATAAGGFTLDILSALAKGLIKQKLKQHTGVEIDL